MKKLLFLLLAGSCWAAAPQYIDVTVGAGDSGISGGTKINNNIAGILGGTIGLTNPIVIGGITNLNMYEQPVATNMTGMPHGHTNAASGGKFYYTPGQTRLIAAGDSMTSYGGTPAAGSWFSVLTDHTNYAGRIAAVNLAKSGDALTTQLASWHDYFSRYLPAPGQEAVVLPWIGINDKWTDYAGHAAFTNAIIQKLTNYWYAFRTNNFKVAGMTMFNAGGSPTIDLDKSNSVYFINVWMRDPSHGTKYFDFLIDPDSYHQSQAWGTGTVASADNLHPTAYFSARMATNVATILAANGIPSTNILTGISSVGQNDFWHASREAGNPAMKVHGSLWMCESNAIEWYDKENFRAVNGIYTVLDGLYFKTYGRPRLYIGNAENWGKIGITVAAPAAQLHITPYRANVDVQRWDYIPSTWEPLGFGGSMAAYGPTNLAGVYAGRVSSNGTWYIGTANMVVVSNDMVKISSDALIVTNNRVSFGRPVAVLNSTNPVAPVDIYGATLPLQVERRLTAAFPAETIRLSASRTSSAVEGWGPSLTYSVQDTDNFPPTQIGQIAVVQNSSGYGFGDMRFGIGNSGYDSDAILNKNGMHVKTLITTNNVIFKQTAQWITSNSFGAVPLGQTHYLIANTNGVLGCYSCDGWTVGYKQLMP
jgi:hypothetical protein